MRLSDGCRLIAFTVLAASLSESGIAAKLTDLQHTRIEEPRPAGLPSDAELEAAGVEFQGPLRDTGVCHMAFFRDPDGNQLMLHHRYAPPAG